MPETDYIEVKIVVPGSVFPAGWSSEDKNAAIKDVFESSVAHTLDSKLRVLEKHSNMAGHARIEAHRRIASFINKNMRITLCLSDNLPSSGTPEEEPTRGPWRLGEGYEQSVPGYYIYSEPTGYIVYSEDVEPTKADLLKMIESMQGDADEHM